VTDQQRIELFRQLDRVRQAGREAFVLEPEYADLELEITICVSSSSYCGEVEERVLEALFGRKGIRQTPGFFSPDNFTFGTPLERSKLEAAIQEVEGVRAVDGIQYQRRASFRMRPFAELCYQPDPNEIIRIENNPNLPERGSVKLIMEGGA
jgi:hypothetical protein